MGLLVTAYFVALCLPLSLAIALPEGGRIQEATSACTLFVSVAGMVGTFLI